MKDEQICALLREYQEVCMGTDPISNYMESEHEYSKRFHKKMKRLLWSYENFQKDIRMGYAVRRIAMILLILMGLFAANEVSARFFGFDAWKTIRSLVDGGKGTKVEYLESQKEEEMAKPKRKEPDYIPEGYQETERDESEAFVTVFFQKSKKEKITYSRMEIIDGGAYIYDAEYDEEKMVTIANYQARLIYDGDGKYLWWYDEEYEYSIISGKIADEEIIKMAESIYK